jgi:hypothetical protein
MTGYLDDPERFAYFPLPVFHELYTELDLLLLTADGGAERWPAIIAGTAEVLDRLDYVAAPKVLCRTGIDVIKDLLNCKRTFDDCGQAAVGSALCEPISLLTDHQRIHQDCATQIRAAFGSGHHDETVTAITTAAAMLRRVAQDMHGHSFAPLPPYSAAQPDHCLMGIALGPLDAENTRNPLRKQLDGTAGMAGSPEHNPYVAALYELELTTHRRLYRRLYQLCEHVGIDLSEHRICKTPDQVDEEPFGYLVDT